MLRAANFVTGLLRVASMKSPATTALLRRYRSKPLGEPPKCLPPSLKHDQGTKGPKGPMGLDQVAAVPDIGFTVLGAYWFRPGKCARGGMSRMVRGPR